MVNIKAGAKRQTCPSLPFSGLAALVGLLVLVQLYLIPVAYDNALEQTSDNSPTAPHKTRNATTHKRRRFSETPAGTFNGYPIYYRESKPFHSSVQCVGHNFRENAWIHRSCKFRHFCFDTELQDYVVYQSQEEQELQEALAGQQFTDVSNLLNVSVAIGGINTKWTWSRGVPRLEWFPTIRQGELTESYYELDPDVVLIPYHSLFAKNPGHLVWDEFLPIYTLLRIFSLLDHYQPMLMRYILPGEGMWATCDMNDKNREICKKMHVKFLELFGLSIDYFSTNHDFAMKLNNGKRPQSKLICAAHGAAGLGMLTDHGYKLHGWQQWDYDTMHNHGRGSVLYDFRNFILRNVGLEVKPLSNKPPYTLTFAVGSSRSYHRDFSFKAQMAAVKEAFGDRVKIQVVNFAEIAVRDQLKIASETAIYVSACGGGSVTATFLPMGASVFLYYVMDGGIENNKQSGLPARLDWDIFNNMAWMRTHWLPTKEMDSAKELDIFVKLIRQELDFIVDQEVLD